MNELREDWGDVTYSKHDFLVKKKSENFAITNGTSTENRAIFVDNLFRGELREMNESLQIVTYSQEVLPIWIVNEMSGGNRSSGLMMWPGGSLEFNGTRATYVMELTETADWNAQIDTVVSWFKDLERPINLAMLNFEATGHDDIDDLLRRLDNTTNYLYDQLKRNNLTDVNVIHLNDRLMIDIVPLRVINITAIIGDEHYEIIGDPSTKLIKPEEGNAVRIYSKLEASANTTRGFKVQWNEGVPDLQANPQLELRGIIIIAKPGYLFEEPITNYTILKTSIHIHITNALDSVAPADETDDEEDGVFFFATGPAFEKNCTLGPLNNEDLYPLVCHVLDINCHRSRDIGSFEECVKEIQKESTVSVFFVVLTSMAIFLITVAAVLIFTIRRRRQQTTFQPSVYGTTEDTIKSDTK